MAAVCLQENYFTLAKVKMSNSVTQFYTDLVNNPRLPRVTTEFLVQYKENACGNETSSVFKTLPFQDFVKVFLGPKMPYRSIMLLWGTGVGKTCAAAQITESLRSVVQIFGKKIYIIAPENLQENYRQTLSSACVGKEGIEPSSTYEFYTYRRFVSMVDKYSNDEDEFHQRFDNAVYMIDEVHNLNNLTEEDDIGTKKRKKDQTRIITIENTDNDEQILEEINSEKTNGVLDKFKTFFGKVRNAKLIMMTATPVRNDNIEILHLGDLIMLNEKLPAFEKSAIDVKPEQIRLISQYISFVRGNNQMSFPRVEYEGEIPTSLIRTKLILCEPSDYQREVITAVGGTRHFNMINNTILATCILAFPYTNSYDDQGTTKGIETFIKTSSNLTPRFTLQKIGNVIENEPLASGFFLAPKAISTFSAKIALLMKNLLFTGVHYVYSRMLIYGTNLVAIACQLAGWDMLTVDAYGQTRHAYTVVCEDGSIPVPRCWCGRYEKDHGDCKHSFEQGHIMLYTGALNSKQEIVKNMLAIINSPENKNGQLCKVFIGSRVSGEGINYKRLRYVHILDPWWNNTVHQQVIGRAVRNCSHASLPEKYRVVKVYRYAIDNTTDIDIYQSAERKMLNYSKLLRRIKMYSVDCIHNYLWNRIFTRAEIEQIDRDGFYISPSNIKYTIRDTSTLNIGEDNSEECEFMECKYPCAAIFRNPRDINTTQPENEISKYMYTDSLQVMTRIREIIQWMSEMKDIPEFDMNTVLDKFANQDLTLYALLEMITNQDITFIWNGQKGRLVPAIDIDNSNVFVFDAFAHSGMNVPIDFKYSNRFTTGSDVQITASLVEPYEEIVRQQNTIVDIAAVYRNIQYYTPLDLFAVFDRMLGTPFKDINEFTALIEFVDANLEHVNRSFLENIVRYAEENYRSHRTIFQNFILVSTDTVMTKRNEWRIEYTVRYRMDISSPWNTGKARITTHGDQPYKDIPQFDLLGNNYILETKRNKYFFTENNMDVRKFISDCLRYFVQSFVDTGMYNEANAAVVYAYMSDTGLHMVNTTRSSMRKDNQKDQRTVSTGQQCSTMSLNNISRSMRNILDNNPGIQLVEIFVQSLNRGTSNNTSRCRWINNIMRALDYDRVNGFRWFYGYGNYDLSRKRHEKKVTNIMQIDNQQEQ